MKRENSNQELTSTKETVVSLRKYSIKSIKLMSLSLISGILLIILCGFSIFTPKNWIIGGGSTSVDPIMTALTPWYKKNYKTDFVYNSMGSAAAPVGITNKYYDLGFESKKINPIKGATTFTIAQDYFTIIFKLPKGITTVNDHNTIELDPTATKPTDLGGLMKGIYNGETWGELNEALPKVSDKNQLLINNSSLEKLKIATFTRESGSGTRDYMEKNIIGKAGTTNNASVETSNGGMLQAVNSSANGAVGYLSFSYMSQILSDNLTVATVGGFTPYETGTEKSPIFNQEYILKRPFAGVVRNDSKNLKKCLEFINRILWTWKPNDSGTITDLINNQIYGDYANPISKAIYNLGFQPAWYNVNSYDTTNDNSNSAIYQLMEKNGINPDKDHNPFIDNKSNIINK